MYPIVFKPESAGGPNISGHGIGADGYDRNVACSALPLKTRATNPLDTVDIRAIMQHTKLHETR